MRISIKSKFRPSGYLIFSSGNQIFFLLFIAIFLSSFVPIAHTSDAVQIGQSNSPYATAYNNTRKIVRTSFDRRVVVFQDSVNGRPAIKWTYSDDGISWSEPRLLDYGYQPALTINAQDRIYGCWISDDGRKIVFNYLDPDTTEWGGYHVPCSYAPVEVAEIMYPGIEVTDNTFNLIFQARQYWTWHIFYVRFTHDITQCLSTMIMLSAEDKNSTFPIVAGDLEFEKEIFYIFWTDDESSQANQKIGFGFVEEKITNNTYYVTLGRKLELPFSGLISQSISVRSYDTADSYSSDIVLAMTTPDKSSFVTSLVTVNSNNAVIFGSDVITVSQNPLPVVDDVYIRSCAICWRDSDRVYYGQYVDNAFVTNPIAVSDENAIARFPNICYKTFRRDVFDVIWTEGDAAPYKIMYRRMDKMYEPVNVEKSADDNFPEEFALYQNYPNPFNPETEISYQLPKKSDVELTIFNLQGQKIRTLFSGQQPAGTHHVKWNGLDENGNAVASGVYLCQMRAGKFVETRKMLLLR